MTPRMSSSRTSVYFFSSSFTSVPPYLLIKRRDFAVITLLAGAEGNHLGLLRLFFGAVRDNNTSADLLFFFDVFDENTITDGLDFNVSPNGWIWVEGWNLVLITEQSAPPARSAGGAKGD